MKKLLFVIALGAFAACGSGSGSTPTNDSAATVAANDSAAMKAAADSAAMKMAADSAAAKMAADSAAKAGKKGGKMKGKM